MTGTGNFLPIVANVTHHVLTASNVFLPHESVPVFFTTEDLSLSLFLFLQNLDFLNIICIKWWNSCFNKVLVVAILKKKLLFFTIGSSRLILQTAFLNFITGMFLQSFLSCVS